MVLVHIATEKPYIKMGTSFEVLLSYKILEELANHMAIGQDAECISEKHHQQNEDVTKTPLSHINDYYTF